MSRRLAEQARREGGAMPPSISHRLEMLEKAISALTSDYRPVDAGLTPPGSGFAGNKLVGTAPKAPTIKPRLEDLIARLSRLNSMADGLSHTIYGDGNPGETAATPPPFTVPDMLEVIEAQISRLDDRLNGIIARF